MVTLFGTLGDDVLTGTADDDSLLGNGGNDTLNGGPGLDTMVGGRGNDVYIVDSFNDLVFEADDSVVGDNGIDTIRTTLDDFDLFGQNAVENLTFIGSGGATLFGNALDNLLLGNNGDDTLISSIGFDTLRGFGGNDTLAYDGDIATPSSQRVTFDGGAGIDVLTLSNSVVTNTPNGPVYNVNLINATLTSIEQLQFASTAGAVFRVQIGFNQLGNGLVNNLTLNGGAGFERLNVIALASGPYQLPDFNFVNWTTTSNPASSDIVSLVGIAGQSYTLRAATFHDGIQGLVGADQDDVLIGGFSNEILVGGLGNDTLNPDDGDDTMTGGAGDDIFVVEGRGTKVITDFTVGTDKIDLSNTGVDTFANLLPILSFSNGNSVLTATLNGVDTTYTFLNVASLTASDFIFSTDTEPRNETGTDGVDLVVGAGGDDFLQGLGDDDTLNGFAGNDFIDGGAGNDTMVGQGGDDTFVVDSTSDRVSEQPGAGNDTIETTLASLSLTSYANVENLTYVGAGGGSLTGDAGDNSLSGGGGNDTLNGAVGFDTLSGNDGNDTLVHDGDIPASGPSSPRLTFDGGNGIDTLSISNSVVTNTPTGPTYDVTLASAGLSSIERLQFNSAANTTFRAFIVAPQLGSGFAFNAELVGGAGYDKFFVIALNPGEYQLPNLTLTNWTTTSDPVTSDVVVLVANQNAGNFTLRASHDHSGFQALVGQDGNDGLFGGAGNDILVGNAGNDVLSPDDGTDTMTGGAGSDIFLIDGDGIKLITDFTIGQDKIDLTGTGFDDFASIQPFLSEVNGNAVLSAFPEGIATSYTLQGVTLASLTASDFIFSTDNSPVAASGTANSELINGRGDRDVIYGVDGNDTLNGFAGDDTLDGGPGNDRMAGGADDDTYIVDSRNDVVVENSGGGVDTIITSLTSFGLTNLPEVENLAYAGQANVTLTGNVKDNLLSAGLGSDRLSGGDGDDTLRGGVGNDTLTGGNGNDVFLLDGPGAVDQVNDFTPGSDFLDLASKAFTALDQGPLQSIAFEAGAGLTTASTVDVRLIYNATSGTLYYDADGSDVGSTPIQIATLIGAPALTAGDIFVDVPFSP